MGSGLLSHKVAKAFIEVVLLFYVYVLRELIFLFISEIYPKLSCSLTSLFLSSSNLNL